MESIELKNDTQKLANPDSRRINGSISLVRILAAVAVILLHTCNTLFNNSDQFVINDGSTRVLTMITALSNWAVPAFFMISGILLLDEKRIITPEKCLKKYCRRIIIALFLFGVPFAWIERYFVDRNLNLGLFLNGFLDVINGNSWNHLWYLYSLLGIYITLPIWKTFINHSDKRLQLYVLTALFVFNFFFTVINQTAKTTIAFVLPITAWNLFYFLLGKFVYDYYPIKERIGRSVIICIASITVLLFVCYVTYPNQFDYLGYSSPIIALACIAFFRCLMHIKISDKWSGKLWKLDRLCFGTYLIHPVLVNCAYKFLHITPINDGNVNIAGIILLWIIFTVFSFGISWIMNKITILHKYVL